MVDGLACEEVRDLRYSALRVRHVLVPRARVRLSRMHDVDLAVWVLEVEEAARHDGDWILLVVDANEVGDHGVEEGSPCWVADARRTVGDGLHVYARGKAQRKEHGVELCKRASERVSDLRIWISMP